MPVDHFKVKAEGKLVDIAPKAPVEEGAEIRLELVEVGQHDMHAGGRQARRALDLRRGRVEARRQEGQGPHRARPERRRVRDARPDSGSDRKKDVPITAESEAEKPTRAPRKKKVEEASKSEPEAAADEPVADEPVADEVAEEPVAEESSATEEEAPKPKKKTRRGSRGGRNRRKKPAGAVAAAAAAENGQAEEAPTPATIHVPSPELGQTTDGADADGDQPPKKKRTRRGSRGGRNRRKKPAAASAEAGTESSSG